MDAPLRCPYRPFHNLEPLPKTVLTCRAPHRITQPAHHLECNDARHPFARRKETVIADMRADIEKAMLPFDNFRKEGSFRPFISQLTVLHLRTAAKVRHPPIPRTHPHFPDSHARREMKQRP